jgi:DNA-binding transcriptional MerR regulator
MRTQEVASTAGINPQTLRYYERIGLLQEPPRTPGGYRDYPRDAVRRLTVIRRAKELGFQLDEIDELLGYSAHGPESCASVHALAGRRIDDLDRRIADLTRMRDSLRRLAQDCPGDDVGTTPPSDCPVLDTLDER